MSEWDGEERKLLHMNAKYWSLSWVYNNRYPSRGWKAIDTFLLDDYNALFWMYVMYVCMYIVGSTYFYSTNFISLLNSTIQRVYIYIFLDRLISIASCWYTYFSREMIKQKKQSPHQKRLLFRSIVFVVVFIDTWYIHIRPFTYYV